MSKSLPQFISEIGVEEAAALFQIKRRTAESWLRRDRYPRAQKAPDIVKATDGVVDYEGIYGPDDCEAA